MLLEKKIRVGAVSYLNTKPLIYGFQHGMMPDQIKMVEGYPSGIAAMLKDDEIDIGLIPVAIIPELREHYIISDYCIGSDGAVGSVCLFSEVPLDKIEIILLDYQSRTSVELLKILMKEFWKIEPLIQSTSSDYRHLIKGTTAGLVIGDRAFEQRKISPYITDLGEEWKKFTGLPFVFAAWVSNKKLPETFTGSFNEAILAGLSDIDKVVAENPYALFDLKKYYTSFISFILDDEKRKGMSFFLEKLSQSKDK